MKIKSILLYILLALGLLSGKAMAAEGDFQLSTHLLDVTKWKAVEGIDVILFKQVEQNNQKQWVLLTTAKTNSHGSVTTLLPKNPQINNAGVYKLVFIVEPYFQALNEPALYPQIDIIFTIEGQEHYLIPVKMSNFGYSVYRGN